MRSMHQITEEIVEGALGVSVSFDRWRREKPWNVAVCKNNDAGGVSFNLRGIDLQEVLDRAISAVLGTAVPTLSLPSPQSSHQRSTVDATGYDHSDDIPF